MQNKLNIKHRVYKFIYDYLDSEDFISVETPILTKSTPEGARDYLVPSRVNHGNFYALPQSPQIFKQLLMVAGVEKYFQMARCFRDEDLRADRQPEFTQLDMEMSFIEEEDIFDVCERLFQGMYREITGNTVDVPFPRMDFEEAMEKYGSDKPDTRFDLFLENFTEEVTGCEFKIFNQTIASGGIVVGLAAPGYKDISRKDIDLLTAHVADYGAKGLAFFKVEESELISPITKFFTKEILDKIREKSGAKTGDMIFMICDRKEIATEAMGALRLKIGKDSQMIDYNRYNFLWIVNFPLFRYNAEENKWASEHHPFTSFRDEDMEHLNKGDLGRIRSRSYDLVLNGSEIASGSIRIHRREIQKKIFDVLGLTDEECRMKFGFLLDAFNYGPPPHGGIAFGIDRIITLFLNDVSIREMIPFPKTQKGTCLLTNAPSPVDEAQLCELGLKVLRKKEEK